MHCHSVGWNTPCKGFNVARGAASAARKNGRLRSRAAGTASPRTRRNCTTARQCRAIAQKKFQPHRQTRTCTSRHRRPRRQDGNALAYDYHIMTYTPLEREDGTELSVRMKTLL